jgi:hypothetical protein
MSGVSHPLVTLPAMRRRIFWGEWHDVIGFWGSKTFTISVSPMSELAALFSWAKWYKGPGDDSSQIASQLTITTGNGIGGYVEMKFKGIPVATGVNISSTYCFRYE